MSAPTNPDDAEVPLQENVLDTVFLVVVCLIPGAAGAFFFYEFAITRGFAVASLLLGLLGAAGMIALFVRMYRTLGKRAALKQRLRERPEEVVWVYERVHSVNDSVKRALVVGFIDGALIEWSLHAPLVELPRLRSWIERRLTHATVGHTPELEARFALSPRELMRAPGGGPR